MRYVYILKSKRYKWVYVGMTNNLVNKVKLHNSGKVESTKRLKPFTLIYYEAHHDKHDAAKRERFLKTGWGKDWIKRTLENYLSS